MFHLWVKDRLAQIFISKHFSAALIFALAILIPTSSAYAQARPDTMITVGLCNVLALSSGSLGAALTIVAGLVTMIGAAMGSYRVAMSVLVVAAGSWLIQPMIELFFGIPVCAGAQSMFHPVLPVGMN
jgi:hypothetical protein